MLHNWQNKFMGIEFCQITQSSVIKTVNQMIK